MPPDNTSTVLKMKTQISSADVVRRWDKWAALTCATFRNVGAWKGLRLLPLSSVWTLQSFSLTMNQDCCPWQQYVSFIWCFNAFGTLDMWDLFFPSSEHWWLGYFKKITSCTEALLSSWEFWYLFYEFIQYIHKCRIFLSVFEYTCVSFDTHGREVCRCSELMSEECWYHSNQPK